MNIDLSKLVTAEEKTNQARAARYADLAELRWSREVGGLSLPDGTRVLTTRESQAQIGSVMACLQSGLLGGAMDWKLATGWVKLSPAQIADIAAAVSSHVRHCFAAERAVAEQMDTLPGNLAGFDIACAFEAALVADGG